MADLKKFNGFTEKTNDFLVGIRFNNNKDFFHSNKEIYRENVHEPMVLLANYCYEYLHKHDENFCEVPKISRINRDIRFSKNKAPYKESKWFFLRADGKPDLLYPKPTFFFEISPDWYRYGFFFSPVPKGMELYRKKADSDIAGFERMVACVNKLRGFDMSGDDYKRRFSPPGMPDNLALWYNKKDIIIAKYGDYSDKDFYTSKLAVKIAKSFVRLYPAYKYFDDIVIC